MPQIKKRVYLHSQNGITPWSTCFSTAEIAQLVEHNLAKVGVASSSLVFRSKSDGWLNANHFIFCKLTRTSDPKLPPVRGLGGVNKSSREMPARSAGSSLVFRSKSDGWLNANHFYFLQTDSHERPHVAPYQGVRGCQQKFARNARECGLVARFPLQVQKF